MPLNVAFVGSSGGGAATIGHTDPRAFTQTLQTQLQRAGLRLSAIQIVATTDGSGFDNAQANTPTALYTLAPSEAGFAAQQAADAPAGGQSGPLLKCEFGRLKDINCQAALHDVALAKQIEDGQIKGLIMVSADPVGVNKVRLLSLADGGEVWVAGPPGFPAPPHPLCHQGP